MKTGITIVALILSLTTFSQSLKKKIESNLLALSEYNENIDYSYLDFDSLSAVTGKNLVSYLKNKPIYFNDRFSNFKKIVSKDSTINLYTFSYSSHGTRGDVGHPVIQWKKKDNTYGAYELFHSNKKGFCGLEVNFSEIHKLPSKNRNLYLLMGAEKGSTNLYLGVALVIEIKNDYLILDYPAFFDSSSTLGFFDHVNTNASCILCMDYISKSATITIKDIDLEDEIGHMLNSGQVKNRIKKVKNLQLQFIADKFVIK